MPPEIVALMEKPHLLIAVLVVGAFAGMTVEQFLSKVRRQAWCDRNRWRWERKRSLGTITSGPWVPKPDSAAPKQPNADLLPIVLEATSTKQPDAADQLRIVMGASFTPQPLLNKSEARLFKELDRVVISCSRFRPDARGREA